MAVTERGADLHSAHREAEAGQADWGSKPDPSDCTVCTEGDLKGPPPADLLFGPSRAVGAICATAGVWHSPPCEGSLGRSHCQHLRLWRGPGCVLPGGSQPMTQQWGWAISAQCRAPPGPVSALGFPTGSAPP